jgi:hypothetical protein
MNNENEDKNIDLYELYNKNRNNVRKYIQKIIVYYYNNIDVELSFFYVNSTENMLDYVLKNHNCIFDTYELKRYELTLLTINCLLIINRFADDLFNIKFSHLEKFTNIPKKEIKKYHYYILKIIDYNILAYINKK